MALLPINIPPVPHFDDQDDKYGVLNLVNDSVIADSNPLEVRLPL